MEDPFFNPKMPTHSGKERLYSIVKSERGEMRKWWWSNGGGHGGGNRRGHNSWETNEKSWNGGRAIIARETWEHKDVREATECENGGQAPVHVTIDVVKVILQFQQLQQFIHSFNFCFIFLNMFDCFKQLSQFQIFRKLLNMESCPMYSYFLALCSLNFCCI